MDQKANERDALNGRDTVLFVVGAKSDVSDQVRTAVGRPVEVAMSCTEALDRAPWERIGLVIALQSLPDTPGAQFLRLVAARHPAIRRVIAVKVDEQELAHAALRAGDADRYLRAPLDPERVDALVRAAFGRPEPSPLFVVDEADGSAACARKVYEAVMAAVPQTLVLVDENHIVHSVNKPPPHTAWSADEIVGLSITDTVARGLKSPEQIGTAIDVVLSEHRPVSLGEVAYRDEGGPERIWKVELFPVDLPGDENLVLVDISDETERQRLWLSLVEAEKMAGVGMLAGGVAHEFNNLLGGIMGFAQLAEMSGELDDYKRLAEAALENGDRAQKITSDLQALAGSDRRMSSTAAVEESIDQVVTLVEKRARKRNVLIEKEVQPALMLHTDFGSLQQVLLQFLFSAIAGMPDGGRIMISAAVAEDGRFRLEVIDDGPPFGQDVLPNVFMPFPTIKRRTLDGDCRVGGVGLAVPHAVVESLGGTTTAENRAGTGVRITVTLPAAVVVT